MVNGDVNELPFGHNIICEAKDGIVPLLLYVPCMQTRPGPTHTVSDGKPHNFASISSSPTIPNSPFPETA